MNKFEEIYNKIISEANGLETPEAETPEAETPEAENSEETTSKAPKTIKAVKDTFKEFIGKKFIHAQVVVDRKRNIDKNKFWIERSFIKDIKIEKFNKSWNVDVIFDNKDFESIDLYTKRMKDCTPEALERRLENRFDGHVFYQKEHEDPHSWAPYPEMANYWDFDRGQSDDEIKEILKKEIIPGVLEDKEKLLEDLKELNEKIKQINIFLGKEE